MNKSLKSFLTVILTIAMMGFPLILNEVQAQRGGRGGGGARISGGGGGFRGGGMGGGGFQGVSRPPRPSQPIAPGRPGGGSGVRPPRPSQPIAPGRPGGGYYHNVNVKVDHGWSHGWGGVAAGVAGAVAAGSVVYAISSAARPVVYGGTTYYQDGNTYYKKCFQGDEEAYCVVENPNP